MEDNKKGVKRKVFDKSAKDFEGFNNVTVKTIGKHNVDKFVVDKRLIAPATVTNVKSIIGKKEIEIADFSQCTDLLTIDIKAFEDDSPEDDSPEDDSFEEDSFEEDSPEEDSPEEGNTLKEIIFPKNITTFIGHFNVIQSIEKIDLSQCDKLEKIKKDTFWGCNALKEVKLPESITTIEDNAFFSCRSMKEINIPNRVTSIRKSAFKDCNALGEKTLSQYDKFLKKEARKKEEERRIREEKRRIREEKRRIREESERRKEKLKKKIIICIIIFWIIVLALMFIYESTK